MERRLYYDHEPAYRSLESRGGLGWDDYFTDDPPDDSYAALTEFLCSLMCPKAQSALALDLGCGGGQAAIILARYGYRVVGVDYAETAVRLARQNANKAGVQAEFLCGDVATEGCSAISAYDLVIDNHVSHCLIEPQHRRQFFLNAFSALRLGGLFFSEVMIACEHFDRDAMKVHSSNNYNSNKTRIWVTRSQLSAELEAAGFHILSQTERPQVPASAGCLLATIAFPYHWPLHGGCS